MCDDVPTNMPVVGQKYSTADMWSRLKENCEPEPWTRQYWKGQPSPQPKTTTTTTNTTTNSSSLTTTANGQLQQHVVDFVFTPTHWHYGWRSNKHTNKSRHTCRIYVFNEVEEGTLLCIESTSDGAFTISSTKKKSPEIPPGALLAPIGADALPEYGKQQHKRKQTKGAKRGGSGSGSGKKESGVGSESTTSSKVRQPKKKKRRKTGGAMVVEDDDDEGFLRTPPLSCEHSPRTQAHTPALSSVSSVAKPNTKRSVSNDSNGGRAEGISEAYRALISMGLPSAFNSDENSWDQKRLSSSGAFDFIFYPSRLVFFF
jgi:hypothetical protein